MILTNENGTEYEVVDEHMLSPEHDGLRTVCLRPVKQEPKYTVILADPYKGMGEIRVELPYPGADQAQLIKACIEATMEHLMEGRDLTMQDLASRFKHARHSIMRENN